MYRNPLLQNSNDRTKRRKLSEDEVDAPEVTNIKSLLEIAQRKIEYRNLDSKTSLDIMRLFEEIHEMGNTLIVVTHEEEVASHAHRILRLRDGMVESDLKNENIVKLI